MATVSERAITSEMIVVAARRLSRPGLSKLQAVICAVAELHDTPLDPDGFDDAAVILRCERLVRDGVDVAEALAAARRELTTWGIPQERGEE